MNGQDGYLELLQSYVKYSHNKIQKYAYKVATRRRGTMTSSHI